MRPEPLGEFSTHNGNGHCDGTTSFGVDLRQISAKLAP